MYSTTVDHFHFMYNVICTIGIFVDKQINVFKWLSVQQFLRGFKEI